jgi:VanZ family protein
VPARGSPLPRYLLAAYVLLVVYASLHPFSGWRGQGLSPFAFLDAPWPRYLTNFDIGANVIAYVPLGALGLLALPRPWRTLLAVVLVTAGGASVSLMLEAAQSYLPSRIPSSLDVAWNSVGTAMGALLALYLVPGLLDAKPLRRLRQTAQPGALADAGLVLLAMWLFTQLDPTTLLFGTGDLRRFVQVEIGRARVPGFFVTVETLIAAANAAATGMLASAMLRDRGQAGVGVLLLVGAALCVRTAAFAILMRAEDVLAWLTPGAAQGLLAGLILALLALALPRTVQLSIAAVLLMAATVLVNLAPPNPYVAATLKVWEQGHFLNFNGLTRIVSAAWPFVAIGYAIALAGRTGRNAAQ